MAATSADSVSCAASYLTTSTWSSISADTCSTPGIRDVPSATWPAQLWHVSSTMSMRSSVACGAIAASGAGGCGVRRAAGVPGDAHAAHSRHSTHRMRVLTDPHSALCPLVARIYGWSDLIFASPTFSWTSPLVLSHLPLSSVDLSPPSLPACSFVVPLISLPSPLILSCMNVLLHVRPHARTLTTVAASRVPAEPSLGDRRSNA